MQAKLTNQYIKKLKPKTDQYEIVDVSFPGFSVRVLPSGKKIFSLRYYLHGQRVRETVGHYGDMTLKEAHAIARKIVTNAQLKNATTSRGQRQYGKMTINELAEMYFREGVGHKKKQTNENDKGRMKRHISPCIGDKPIGKLTKIDIYTLKSDIETGKTVEMARQQHDRHHKEAVTLAKQTAEQNGEDFIPPQKKPYPPIKGTPQVAKSCIGLVSATLSFAVDLGMLEVNVAKGVRLPKTKIRKEYLKNTNLDTLGGMLPEFYEQSPFACDIVILLLLTGCRLGEIATLKWEHVNIEKHRLELQDAKSGDRYVYISDAALAFLKDLPRFTSPYLFPSRSSNEKPFCGTPGAFRKMWAKADMQHFRLHDIRRTFASTAAEQNINTNEIGELLGHAGCSTTDGYITRLEEKFIENANKVCDIILFRLGVSIKKGDNFKPISNENSDGVSQKIGRRLKKAREEQGFTREEICRLSGLSLVALENIEGCRPHISMGDYRSALSALELLTGLQNVAPEPPNKPNTKKSEQLDDRQGDLFG